MARVAGTVLLVLVALIPGAWAAPAPHAIDPVHTRVAVTVDHAGFSKAIGTLSGSTGTIDFDPDDWSSARLEVSLPITALDFGDANWNRAVLARGLLDAEQHPTARFVSTRVEPVDAGHFTLHGDLTLRGVTREVRLDVSVNAIKRHPMPPFRRTAGFSATGTLSRAAFGIDAWPSMIGDAIDLRIELEATRSRGEASADGAEKSTTAIAGEAAEEAGATAAPAKVAPATGPVPDVDVRGDDDAPLVEPPPLHQPAPPDPQPPVQDTP